MLRLPFILAIISAGKRYAESVKFLGSLIYWGKFNLTCVISRDVHDWLAY